MFNRNKSHTLNQCRDYYLEDCMARGQSPRTLETKKSCLRFFVQWCERQGVTRARRVKPDHLEQYRLYVCRYHQPFNLRPLDMATQRNRLTAVKVFFRRLKRRGLIITIGGENVMKTREVNSWFWNQGNQPGDKIQRFDHAIALIYSDSTLLGGDSDTNIVFKVTKTFSF